MYRLGIDVMSGDNPPSELIGGCVESISRYPQAKICIIGDENEITRTLKKSNYPEGRIDILHSDEIITMNEHPAKACRQKKTSSVMVGTGAVNSGKIDAFFSPGNTGATLASSLYSIGRLRGVKRPAVGVFMPNTKGRWTLVLDVGANVDCHYKYLKQFAIMGVCYFAHQFRTKNPRIGILNVGEEKTKGNELTQRTYREMEKLPFSFVGNVEPYDIIKGKCDVLICDGFVGNILLKSFEGVSKYFMGAIKDATKDKFIYLLGAYLLKGKFMSLKRDWDPRRIGAAPLLGIAKPVFIGHGNTNTNSIIAAVKTILDYLNLDMQHHIQKEINKWS